MSVDGTGDGGVLGNFEIAIDLELAETRVVVEIDSNVLSVT